MIARMPLVDLELTRLSRRWTTYALRAFVAAGALIYITSYGSLQYLSSRQSPEEAAQFLGQMLSHTAGLFQWFVALAVAPLLTAGAIAEERRQGTLSTLMLAEFRGRQIYFAKLMTAVLHVELMLLSVLPLLAIASLFGGIDVPLVCRQFVVLTATAIAVSTLGLWYSTKASTPLEALFYTVLTVSLWLGATEIIDRILVRLGGGGLLIGMGLWSVGVVFGGPTTTLAMWLPGVAIALCISLCALLAALRALPKAAVARNAPPKRRQPSKSNWILDRCLPIRPLGRLLTAGGEGLVVHSWRRRMRMWAALGLVPLAFLPCAGTALLWALICYDVTSTIGAARRNGALDGLMVAPETSRAFAKTILQTFLRRSLLFLPALAGPILYYFALGISVLYEPAFFISQLLLPLLYLFTCVSVGCMVSLLPGSPVAQTCMAVLGILVYNHASWRAVSMLLTMAGVGRMGPSVWASWAVSLALTGGLGVFAYFMFRRFLGYAWRNERAGMSHQTA
ncbi:MAG: hypothetical protein GY851_25455 [bacterium]|nr:hypothetical protein [bacterium]